MPKKNGKIWVCVDYQKLNVATVTDAFPLPFMDGVLDTVVGHEVYSFLDGFSSYNEIRMHPDNQDKTSFVTDDVWAQDHVSDLPTNNHENIWRVHPGIHAGIPG